MVEVSNKIYNFNDTQASPYEIAENVEVEIEENYELEITITAGATSDEEIRIMI